mgnify:CR=1 FL=1
MQEDCCEGAKELVFSDPPSFSPGTNLLRPSCTDSGEYSGAVDKIDLISAEVEEGVIRKNERPSFIHSAGPVDFAEIGTEREAPVTRTTCFVHSSKIVQKPDSWKLACDLTGKF